MLRASSAGRRGSGTADDDTDVLNDYRLHNPMSSRHNEPPMSPRTQKALHHQTVSLTAVTAVCSCNSVVKHFVATSDCNCVQHCTGAMCNEACMRSATMTLSVPARLK
jgi:hypothetical protein